MRNSRRSFLKTQLALGACMATGLDVISAPASAANLSGYKALVCVYLAGGNDSYNMFVPFSAEAHADYARARQFLTLPRSQILPVTPVSYSDGQAYGFHPSMPETQRLFGTGELAVIANVGSLVRQVTRDQYENKSVELPKQLFSHNDQTDSWLAANARGANGIGWAGRMMDIMYPNGAPQPSPSISVGGNTVWQTGRRVRSFEVGTNGVGSQFLPNHRGPLRLRDAFRLMHRQSLANSNNVFVTEHTQTLERAEAFGASVNTALQSAPDFSTPFPDSRLASQLRMVANLIAVRDELDTDMSRQVFFCRIGGWDTHNDQASETNVHAGLLSQVDQALSAFYSAIGELGEQSSVTTFTATEFGRTLTPNGSGTDHGWGGHSLVLGGAVDGGDIYGAMPQISVDSPDAIKGGRMIPTLSVDQYSATLARWFGLNNAELDATFPNLANFLSRDIGFMA